MGIRVTGVYKGRTCSFDIDTVERPPLNVADDETLIQWLATPEWDDRTLAEFATSGGARIAPPGFMCKPEPPPPPPALNYSAVRLALPPSPPKNRTVR